MSQLSKSPNLTADERLADFTERALAGKMDQVELDADDELIALEKTILRLKRAIPPAGLDQAEAKRMQVRFKARIRREAQQERQPFWKKWFEPQPRLQFAMAFAVAAALIAFVIVSPSIPGSSTSGTALNPATGTFVVAALAGILFVLLWIKRRR
jgi:hypothetical protein